MSLFSSLKSSTLISSPLIETVEFSTEAVYDHLSNIDASKACGPDLLSEFLLKNCAVCIASSLAYLFNLSMHTGSLPKDWVTANVVPVLKCNKRSVVSNY